MNAIRDRAKEHFPTVLLTLLSIVQALALELLWSHLHESDYLFEPSWVAVISWVQIAATVAGIILIWVVYSSNVMRFRFVPVTSDTVYPFLVGMTEFILIDTLGPDDIGLWLLIMGAVFGLMSWVAHSTMRRARQDSENEVYFRSLAPAELRDFLPDITVVCGLGLAGTYLLVTRDHGLLAMLALLATNGILAWQSYRAAKFWNLSVADTTHDQST